MQLKILTYKITLVLLLCATWANASDLRFKRLSIEDGLSQSRVFAIDQDSKGFIWVATEDGLNRYDGYEFTIFTFDPKDSSSINNNVLLSLAADDSGNVWVGTSFGGLNKYDARTGKFIAYRHNPDIPNTVSSGRIDEIHRDKKGNLWLGATGSGIDYFDLQSGQITNLRHDPHNQNSLINDMVNFIYEDSHGSVWIGTDTGLDRYYPATGNFRHYTYDEKNKKGINTNQVLSVCEDRQGYIWFGTGGGGLNRFDPQTESFTHFLIDPNDLNSLSNVILAVKEDRTGTLWVGTPGAGLYRLETHLNKYQQFLSHPTDISSLSQDVVTVIFEDKTGELWIGTDLNGINKIDRSASKFKSVSVIPGEYNSLSINQVRSFWEDDDGILWLGTAGGGLDRFDRRNNSFKNYRHAAGNPNSISSDFVRSIYQDRKGTIWLGTADGLNRFDPRTAKFKRIAVEKGRVDLPLNLINYRIIESSTHPDMLWFGSSGGGLCSYNIPTGELKQYLQQDTDPSSSQINFVRTLHQSQKDQNILWVGTLSGMCRFDIQAETFKPYSNNPHNSNSLSSNNVMGFYEENDGNLWVATYGGGINYFNTETEEFDVITTGNSDLPSNSVYGFLPDNNGFLWISSNRGISRFDPRNQTFKNYTVEDGLQSDEFNGGAYYKSKSGELFFGGISGFNAFYPESITDNKFKPQVEITDFKLFNQSVAIGAESPLQKHISETNQIVLEHWQNDIELGFVALHFYRSNNNTYAYKLDNYDIDWRFVGTDRSAIYTNLDPGEYTFRVKAANSDGIWNEDGKVLSITIMPPWWSTTLAYFGYGLIFLAGVFAIDRFQRFRLTQRERNRSMMREVELRAKAAEDENKRKSHELEEARRLQLSLLPEKLPDLPNLEIAVYMRTATEVGGDYYDFNVSKDGTLNIALGDATGHGMQAGTVVTLMKGLFSADSGRMDIPDFFRQSSDTIKDLRFGRMLMSFTLLKIKNNNLIFSSAGMPPAYIFRQSTLKVEELSLEGLPLGAMKETVYKVIQDKLNAGDTLLLLSDGLPELKNPDGQIFDYTRVEQVFRDVADKKPQAIIDRLVDAGDMWSKDLLPDDDVTLMVLKAR
jgi:ligand-binding sensor domain-containing protein/serine phosphatase RsbU (regulator of sigma subunit)